ncbi:hypothetical protein AN958_05639 [Leucoagaricus sp. SymC.cos]|nr:hypothetical protein AN958_05639 [Leucoagaricus sp. SymC.cos]
MDTASLYRNSLYLIVKYTEAIPTTRFTFSSHLNDLRPSQYRDGKPDTQERQRLVSEARLASEGFLDENFRFSREHFLKYRSKFMPSRWRNTIVRLNLHLPHGPGRVAKQLLIRRLGSLEVEQKEEITSAAGVQSFEATVLVSPPGIIHQ